MTRAGHWKRDTCDVYVGRGCDWGNPFVLPGQAQWSRFPCREVELPLVEYEKHVRASDYLVSLLPTLRGKVLGCFCVRASNEQPPKGEETCHAQVLVRLVGELAP